MVEGHGTFCLLLFPGAMASAVDMTTCDRVNIHTQAKVSFLVFVLYNESWGLGGEGDGSS